MANNGSTRTTKGPEQKQTLIMVVGVPALIVLIMFAPRLFKFAPVEVSKAAPQIEKRIFNIKSPPADVGRDESTTLYKFGCDSDLDYKIEEETKGSNGVYHIRLKVTRAKANLTLPITIWLSQIVPDKRSQIEDGHAKICERVYVDAHIPAKEACTRALERTYYGQSTDRQRAIDEALNQAREEIKQQYIDAVESRVKDVYVIYDFYAPNWQEPTEVLVDKALQEYEVGKPRKLSTTSDTTQTEKTDGSK